MKIADANDCETFESRLAGMHGAYASLNTKILGGKNYGNKKSVQDLKIFLIIMGSEVDKKDCEK